MPESPATSRSAARASATNQAASSADIFPDFEFPVLDSPFPPYAPDSAEWLHNWHVERMERFVDEIYRRTVTLDPPFLVPPPAGVQAGSNAPTNLAHLPPEAASWQRVLYERWKIQELAAKRRRAEEIVRRYYKHENREAERWSAKIKATVPR
ncbi:hypothetical protein NBRC10513v2_000676 [Rhodotorula toruloides]